jgi:hypothetical protein
LEASGSRHSGQAKRDPETRIFEYFWIPAFAGMTQEVPFAKSSNFFLRVNAGTWGQEIMDEGEAGGGKRPDA